MRNEKLDDKKEKVENYVVFYPIILPKKDINELNNEIEFKDSDKKNTQKCFSKFKKIENKEYFFGIYWSILHKKSNEIKFKLNENNYELSFKIRQKVGFIFQTELKKKNSILSKKEKIEQNNISFKDKFEEFYESLEILNKMEYLNYLINEAIDTLKGEPTFEYFILLICHCYNDKNINLLFENKPKEFKETKIKENELLKLKDKIKEIYNQRNEIFKIFNEDKEVDTNNSKKDSKKKETKEKYINIFYFSLIYFFLLIKDEDKAKEIIEDLNNEDNQEGKIILFDIFKKYSLIFQNFDIINKSLLNDLISDSNETNFNNIKNILNYEKDTFTLLELLDNNKTILIAFPEKDSKNIINIYEHTRQNKNDEIKKICEKINSLISFQKNKGVLLLDFSKEFWEKYVNFFNTINTETIDKLNNLKNSLKEYYLLLNKYCKKAPKEINKSISDYYKKDSYGNLIHNLIYQIIKDKKPNELELLEYIFKKDPYYYDISKKDLRDVNILKLIDFKNIKDEKFYELFVDLKIDEAFESKIHDFYDYFFSLIDNIYDFELLFKLFKIDKMKGNSSKEYINNLRNKFNDLKLNFEDKKEMDNKTLEITINIIIIILKKQSDKILDFFAILEKKLKENNYIEIYIKLLENSEIKLNDSVLKYILQKIKNSNNSIDYSMKFLNLITDSNKRKKYFEYVKGYTFEYKDFFENNKNKEINLFISLTKNKLFDEESKKSDYFKKNTKTINELKNKFDKFDLELSYIDSLLKLEESKILERFQLINDNSEELLQKIKKKYEDIKNEIDLLKKNKEILNKFYPKYIENNQDIKDLISSLENGNLNILENNKKIQEELYNFKENNKENIETIIKIQDSLYFNNIYKKKFIQQEEEDDEFSIFRKAKNELDKNKKIIEDPEEIDSKSLNEFILLFSNDWDNLQLEKEFKILSEYYNNNNNINIEFLKDKIFILKNAKNYINDINNIIFFLTNIKIKKTDFFEKLEEIFNNLKLLNNNEKEKKYEKIKKYLGELKENNIYNYLEKKDSIQFFKFFYDKELAIAFLINKKNDPNIAKTLGERLDPLETTLTNQDIDNFQNCINFIQDLKIEEKNDKQLFYLIKEKIEKEIENENNNKILKCFENYCNNYKSIQEIDENFDDSNSISKKVDENINTGIFYFFKIKDEYKKNNEDKTKYGYNYLYDLKCKINIKSDEKDENMKEKNNRLKYFDNLVNKITKIRDMANYLRNKGSQIELLIEVHFCYNVNKNTGKFILGQKEQPYKYIINYLNDVKNYYNDILMRSYLEKEYLRFTYGKQFNFIVDYLMANNNDNSFAYYFLNEKPKNDLNRAFPLEANDSITFYKTYLQNTLENISNYIQKYFEDNYGNEIIEKEDKKNQVQPLENFYNLYKVRNSKFGINYIKSEDKSIEETAIDLFMEFTGKYPISQNILLINKDTSDEELECFLFRSILCNYHTLFIIGIYDITNSQEDNLLNITNKLMDFIKIRDNKNIKNLSKIKANIKSCIIFIYNHDSKFIDNIKKIANYKDLTRKEGKKEQNGKTQKNIDSIQFKNRQSLSYDRYSDLLTTQDKVDEMKYNNNIDNVIIYISDVNGTGKTFEIKKQIEISKLDYKYFPFGGYLTKNLVYNKIKELLNDIENEDKDKDNICIHLDLYETEQKGIMNDFLFSFLFTKYYKNDENVIYIPRELKIYVEIPNCFISFIETYPILKIFQKIEINLENPKELILSDNEKELFASLGIDKEEEFIKNNIKIENASYYQKRQFINSFLSQITINNASQLNDDLKQNIIDSTQYFTLNCYSDLIKQKNNISKPDDILNQLSKIDNNYNTKFEKPLIFYDKQEQEFFKVDMSENYYKNYKKENYLKDLKHIFNLDNPVKNDDNDLKSLEKIVGDDYVITVDNFRKMVKIYYRIISNINLIIMGETGCGKTLLISKLYQILHNGEEIKKDFKINIHGGYTDEKIIQEINKINKKASEINQDHKIWVFIDEINACNSMGLFNEIICNHSCNGKKLNSKLVFIGACNPYRTSKNKSSINGLIYKGKKQNNILYNVNPLSHSLMNYVFYFGSLSSEDEKKYIKAIIEDIEIFKNNNELDLKDTSTEMLFKGHTYIRNETDASSVSLREINRFKKCFEFFRKYYENKKSVLNDNEIKEQKLNDENIIIRKSIVLSILTCYYLKISNIGLRSEFDNEIKKIFADEKNASDKQKRTLDNINFKVDNIMKSLLKESKSKFSDILLEEEKFILAQIELDDGIAENRPLRDNIFLLFVAINLFIPIFIVGKPGCSKTLSVNLIDKSMSGKFSKKLFFRNYPNLFKTWFQGTENTTNDDVENLFRTAEKKANCDDKSKTFYGQQPISMIFFDEIGLCEVSDNKPLKILNFKFEYESKVDHLSFIGISNWVLDAAKMNRGFTLSVPELHENVQDIHETCEKLVKSINPYLFEDKYKKIFEGIYTSYINYKKDLTTKYNINESENPLCHGSRDFYYLIKNVAFKLNNLLNNNKDLTNEDEIEIVFTAIERNFGALELNEKDSSFIFKELYLNERDKTENNMKIKFNDRKCKNNVIKNIILNIKDKKSRNLLLITKSSLNSLIVETLLTELRKDKETNKIKPIFKIGSSFKNDQGEEYKLKIINQIQKHAEKGDVLILQNFSNVLSSLYELFNLNYIQKDGKKYARISVGNSREQFIEINDNFKVILLFDSQEIEKIMQPTASRFEKIKVEFNSLLNNEEIEEAEKINKMIINKLSNIKLTKKLNYNLKNLIINLDENGEEIKSMFYYHKNYKKESNDIRNYIFEKITPVLPQDIIGCLLFDDLIKSDSNDDDIEKIKEIYQNNEKPNNINEFLEKCKKSKFKFSIVYTFSSISGIFKNNDYSIQFITVSKHKCENDFESTLNKFYRNPDTKILVLKIQSKSVKEILYLKTFINVFEEYLKDKKNSYNIQFANKKIVFTVHMARQFYSNEKKNNTINTISYTSEDVQHLFIDNLYGKDRLEDIFNNFNNSVEISKFLKKQNLNDIFIKKAIDYFELNIRNNLTKIKGINSNNFVDLIEKYLKDDINKE